MSPRIALQEFLRSIEIPGRNLPRSAFHETTPERRDEVLPNILQRTKAIFSRPERSYHVPEMDVHIRNSIPSGVGMRFMRVSNHSKSENSFLVITSFRMNALLFWTVPPETIGFVRGFEISNSELETSFRHHEYLLSDVRPIPQRTHRDGIRDLRGMIAVSEGMVSMNGPFSSRSWNAFQERWFRTARRDALLLAVVDLRDRVDRECNRVLESKRMLYLPEERSGGRIREAAGCSRDTFTCFTSCGNRAS